MKLAINDIALIGVILVLVILAGICGLVAGYIVYPLLHHCIYGSVFGSSYLYCQP